MSKACVAGRPETFWSKICGESSGGGWSRSRGRGPSSKSSFRGVVTSAAARGLRPGSLAIGCVIGLLSACSKDPPAVDRTPASAEPATRTVVRAEEKAETFRFSAAKRVVAIGDVHGDFAAARAALRLAGAIDDQDAWVGGSLVVVQTGDELDRGDQEREIVDLFDALAPAAERAGGAVHALNGNHETMNVAGDFRYVTPGGYLQFAEVSTARVPPAVLSRFPPSAHGRVAAFFPGGPYAALLSKRRIVVVVGDTVFAHGGVTTGHVKYGIERINRESSRWMSGESPAPPGPVTDSEGPTWTRRYSNEDGPIDCAELDRTLEALHARRMVVGHTPQKRGITSACGDRVWRIDVGMAAHYGGRVEVLEIRDGVPRALREAGAR
jgi:hypothetical protein